MIELRDRIILIDSLETVFMKILWKDTKTFTMVGLDNDQNIRLLSMEHVE